MLKQLISFFIILVLSAAVAFFMPEAQKVIQLLVSAHDWVSDILTSVFNSDHIGSLVRELVALLIIPFIAGLIPAIIFFLLRKYWLPCFMEIVWVVWLLQAGALLMVYDHSATAATPLGPVKTEVTQKTEEPAAAPPATTDETHEAAPEPTAE